MSKVIEISKWWQAVAALPADRRDQGYQALRRMWLDHTTTGGRSFFRWGCEDNITPTLFQNWAAFPHPGALASFVSELGGSPGIIKRVRWAFACEERLDSHLQPYHGRNFVIADIMLVFEDEHGLGLVAFEAKKPGVPVEVKDSRKLATYRDLPSTREISRRSGCFLLSECVRERSRRQSDRDWPIVTWERMAELQSESADELSAPSDLRSLIGQWIRQNFARYGIKVSGGEAPLPAFGTKYGTADSYQQIDRLPLPGCMRRFIKGSECVEAVWRGEHPAAPLPWLEAEPDSRSV